MTVSPYDNLPVKGREPKPLEYVEVPVEELVEAPSGMTDNAPADISAEPPAKALDSTAAETLTNTPANAAADASANESAHASLNPAKEAENLSRKNAISTVEPAKSETRETRREISSPAKTEPLPKPAQYTKLSLKNRYGNKEFSLSFEETLLVPDTMADISEILFAEGKVSLSQGCKFSYEKGDSLSGEITLYTVYKPESESNIDIIKSSVPFRTDKCWGDSSCDSFKASVRLKSVDCELLNERKFIAKGELSICFTEILKHELGVFKGVDDPDFVVSQTPVSVTNLSFEKEESTEISQEINVKEGSPLPQKILKEDIRVVENHKQITSGKLVINGTVHSGILYKGELDGEAKVCCVSNKTDFAQFIPLTENADVDLISTYFCYDDLKVAIADEDKFMLEGHVRTLVCVYENRELQMVSDIYHKGRDISFTMETQPLSFAGDVICGEISARETVSLEAFNTDSVTLLCGSCHILGLKGSPEKGRISIEGLLHAKILAEDMSGKPFVISRKIPLRGSLESQKSIESLEGETSIDMSGCVRDFWFDEINGHQIEINAGVSISVWVVNTLPFKTPENLCFVQQETTGKRISLALYVVSQGDTLWDIAKKYKSDCQTIAELNDISPDSALMEGMKLLVMRS